MRCLDTIVDDYGDDARLLAASLVFEVVVGEGDDARYHVNYRSLPDSSPHHIAGLMYNTAAHISSPDTDEED